MWVTLVYRGSLGWNKGLGVSKGLFGSHFYTINTRWTRKYFGGSRVSWGQKGPDFQVRSPKGTPLK